MSDIEPYQLIIMPDAKADLRKIDKATAVRILKKMIWVAENASTLGHEALTGEWSGLFRWRIGDYRVIYAVDHEARTLTVGVIGHRREIYED